MTDQADTILAALSVDALRQAAKRGERAAAVLLIYGEANSDGVSGLAALFKNAVVTSFGDWADNPDAAEELRRVAARAFSIAALDAPARRQRETARAYLKSEGSSFDAKPSLRPPDMVMVARQYASRMLLDEPDHEMPPTWLLADGDGRIAIVPTPYDDAASKDAVAATMRRLMQDQNIVAYAHALKAWMGSPDSTGRPSEDPKRTEVVAVWAYTAAEMEFAAWEIIRDAEGAPIDFKRRGDLDSGYERFGNLLSTVQ